MDTNSESILNSLPYKLKKEKNIDTVYEYLIKQSKRSKIFSIMLLLVGLAQILLLILHSTSDRFNVNTLHLIMIILQMIIFPLLAYRTYKWSKNINLSKEKIEELLK